MTQPDFDELARLWTQEGPEEERLLRALACKAERRAKALRYAELGMGAMLILAVLVAFFVDAAPATLIVGGLTVAAILWAGWRRHYRQAAALAEESSREAMLETAARRGRSKLKRSAAGLALLVPGFLLGALFKYSIHNGGRIGGFPGAFLASVTNGGWGTAGMLLLVAAFACLWRAHRALRREVGRLEQLRRAYRAEAELDGEG